MCATYFINDTYVDNIKELKEFVDPSMCIVEWSKNHELHDEECLCYIDPLLVSIRLDLLVLCDPSSAFYKFIKREER
jgi:hypothetical protein